MASTDQAITLTPLDTNLAAFTVSSTDLISVIGINTNDSSVKYSNNNRTTTIVKVNEAPAAIASASETMITVTLLSTGGSIDLNASRIKGLFTNGSGCIIVIDTEGPAWEEYKVTESRAAVAALINAVADTVPIPLNQHITATTESTSVSTGALVVDGGVGIAKNIYIGGLANVAGQINGAATTDSTSSVTGAVITAGGLGVAKAASIGTTLDVGTNQTFAKEVNHTVAVTTTSTAATVGGSLTVTAGAGATSGAGGALALAAGAGGATGTGGALTVTSGAAAGGTSGAVSVKSGTGTTATGTATVATGNATTTSGAVTVGTGTAATTTGAITFSTGNASAGDSGNIILSPGTATGVVGKIVASNAVVMKHKTAAINSTATATAKEVATGYITSTSAAGTTITLPTGTALGSELGAVQGTVHDLFIDNTGGSNTVTIAVSVNGILSALAAANAASAGLLTVPSGVTGQACFRLMFSSATAFTFSRVA